MQGFYWEQNISTTWYHYFLYNGEKILVLHPTLALPHVGH